MKRVILLSLLLLPVLGCDHQAQSQEQISTVSPQQADQVNPSADLVRSRQTAITRAVEKASPAVVSVNVTEVRRVRVRDPFSDPFFEQYFGRRKDRVYEQKVQALGSGFVISPDGYIVTNDHVAGHASKITVAFHDGKTREAKLIGSDPITDLALIKINADVDLAYMSLSKSPPMVGEWAVAMGNPFGLFEAGEPTVTVGVVSAIGRDFAPQGFRQDSEIRIYKDMIQTDAAINQGNSGGPLINAVGEVMGVNTFIYTESGGSVGIGFAVPAERVLRIITELREKGKVDRSYYTGLYGIDVTERIARAMDLTEARGIFVRDVEPGSPAEKGGFEPYDVITSVENERVDNRADFLALLYDYRPGDEITCHVYRDGGYVDLKLKIGRQK